MTMLDLDRKRELQEKSTWFCDKNANEFEEGKERKGKDDVRLVATGRLVSTVPISRNRLISYLN